MSSLSDRVSYVKGLAEGLKLDTDGSLSGTPAEG